MSRYTSAILAGCLALSACSTTDPPPATPTAHAPAPTDMDVGDMDMEGSETGAAVGLLTTPAAVSVYKWLGQAILQILINTKIDVKVDATGESQKDKK